MPGFRGAKPPLEMCEKRYAVKSGKRARGDQIAPPLSCDWKFTREVAAGMRRFDHIGPLPRSTYGCTEDQCVQRLRPKKYADSAFTSSFGPPPSGGNRKRGCRTWL